MKKLTKAAATVFALGILASSVGVLSAQAATVWGQQYVDQFSTSSSQDTPKNEYRERDISFTANNLNAQTKQNFHVTLYTRNFGIYQQYGSSIQCDTGYSGGGYQWNNANPNRIASYAYLKVKKDASNSITIAGNIKSTSSSIV